ncbi:MAG: nucleotide exchange factor GrpE [Candidatus Eisenbacteria bacterium]|nr:nucleotide exchange factor GrpE [Candidatus Eisenbacteria bacterium]
MTRKHDKKGVENRAAAPAGVQRPDETAFAAPLDEASVEGAASPAAPAPLTAEEEGYLEQLQRLQAEFSNYRKRVSRERTDWDAHAKGELISLLLPVLDDLGRAREAHASATPSPEAEGLLLILSRLQETLCAAGLEAQESEPGAAFDPHLHEAISCEPCADHPEGLIIGTVQPGYLFRGQLLRPARVRVSKGAPADPAIGAAVDAP